MIRIAISEAAYAAIAAGLAGARRREALPSSTGGVFVWLDKVTLAMLRAARGPGEGYSETILRLASEEASAA